MPSCSCCCWADKSNHLDQAALNYNFLKYCYQGGKILRHTHSNLRMLITWCWLAARSLEKLPGSKTFLILSEYLNALKAFSLCMFPYMHNWQHQVVRSGARSLLRCLTWSPPIRSIYCIWCWTSFWVTIISGIFSDCDCFGFISTAEEGSYKRCLQRFTSHPTIYPVSHSALE